MEADKAAKAELVDKIKDLKKKMSSDNAAETEKAEALKEEKRCQNAVKAFDTKFEEIRNRELEIQSSIDGSSETIRAAEEEIGKMESTKRALDMEIDRKRVEIDPYQQAKDKAFEKFERLRKK